MWKSYIVELLLILGPPEREGEMSANNNHNDQTEEDVLNWLGDSKNDSSSQQTETDLDTHKTPDAARNDSTSANPVAQRHQEDRDVEILRQIAKQKRRRVARRILVTLGATILCVGLAVPAYRYFGPRYVQGHTVDRPNRTYDSIGEQVTWAGIVTEFNDIKAYDAGDHFAMPNTRRRTRFQVDVPTSVQLPSSGTEVVFSFIIPGGPRETFTVYYRNANGSVRREVTTVYLRPRELEILSFGETEKGISRSSNTRISNR